jgi:membrane protein DedA with SNARE-associated domain
VFSGADIFNISEALVLSIGYTGIFVLLLMDNFFIPLGGEVLLIFSGVLAFEDKFNVIVVIVVCIAASIVGSTFAWLLGRYGGRPFLMKYGKYVLVRESDIKAGDNFFEKHGEITVFAGRLVPLIRTYISVPAGVAEMKLSRFTAYSLAGIAIFVISLVMLGYFFSSEVRTLISSASTFTIIGAAALLVLLFLAFIRLRESRILTH